MTLMSFRWPAALRAAVAIPAAFCLGLAATPAGAVDIKEVVSPGGITAWLVQESTLPIIAVTFAFTGGATQDPVGKEGVANLLTTMLDEGAGDIVSQDFQSLLEELSIDMSFDSGADEFYGTLRTLTANRDEAFRLLRLALTQPRFDAEPLERMRAAITSNLRYEATDPDSIAGRAFMVAAFPDHPYSRPGNGTVDTVAAITADDLRTFHDNIFARDNLTISVVGDIDEATLASALDSVFGGLAEKSVRVAVPDVEPVASAHVDIAMNIPQTVLRFGGSGVKRDDPDFIPAFIADHILGGGSFSSRLFHEVREVRGLAYSASTGLASMDHAAFEFGGTATRADRADEAMEVIDAEIQRFAAEGPTDEEIKIAKEYLIGNYALRFTSSTRIARQLLGIQLEKLGIDYINRRNDMVAALTPDEIREASKRLFAGGGLIVVRVGQPSTATPPLPN